MYIFLFSISKILANNPFCSLLISIEQFQKLKKQRISERKNHSLNAKAIQANVDLIFVIYYHCTVLF
jgi:hypothetical protein